MEAGEGLYTMVEIVRNRCGLEPFHLTWRVLGIGYVVEAEANLMIVGTQPELEGMQRAMNWKRR
jgi:hypothetical protein